MLQSTWEEELEICKHSETKVHIQGVSSQIQKFKFLFGNMLAEMVLRHTDNLHRAWQHQTMSAGAGQEIDQMTVKTLQSLWNDECFGLFWTKVTLAADHMEVDEPQLPRQHK